MSEAQPGLPLPDELPAEDRFVTPVYYKRAGFSLGVAAGFARPTPHA